MYISPRLLVGIEIKTPGVDDGATTNTGKQTCPK